MTASAFTADSASVSFGFSGSIIQMSFICPTASDAASIGVYVDKV